MKLPRSELEEYRYLLDELDENQTVNKHHCKEGKNNDRLYVTRTSDGLVCYCHHCGGSGFLPLAYSAARKALRRRNSSGSISNVVRLPSDSTGDTRQWSGAARVWTGRAGLTSQEIKDRGLTYSKRHGRVYIPVYLGGELTGYLGRGIEVTDPKYYAMRKDREKFFYHLNKNTEQVVIVEDCMSAIKCFRHVSSFAMLGTSLSDSALAELIKHHKEFIVWTDWDNPGVKMKHASLLQRLSLFGKVRSVHTDKDPKEHSDLHLKEILL